MSGSSWAKVGVGSTWAKVDRPDLKLVAPHCWYPTSKGYARSDRGLMHRVILGLTDDDPRRVDHENRDKLDNRSPYACLNYAGVEMSGRS